VRVEAVPEVHLDVERLPAGEEPPAEHQPCAGGAQPDDRADGDPEPVAVVAQERGVDRGTPGHPDERDLRGLRADREHDRHREADAVGAQEGEQADERPPVRGGAHVA
jgi:hypothetical protein